MMLLSVLVELNPVPWIFKYVPPIKLPSRTDGFPVVPGLDNTTEVTEKEFTVCAINKVRKKI